MEEEGRSGSKKVSRSKRHKLSILRRCSGAGEHAERRQARNVGPQHYSVEGDVVCVVACCSGQEAQQMNSAGQDIYIGSEQCWAPARAPKEGSQEEKSTWCRRPM